jgi:hypothetical protein
MSKFRILVGLIFVFSIFSCKKTEENIIDVKVETKEISSIMINSALCNGKIDNFNHAKILEVGVCWDTISLPTTIKNKIIESVQEVQVFVFHSAMSNLLPSKEYYVRAYAKTNEDVFYGNQQKFKTLPIDSASAISKTFMTNLLVRSNSCPNFFWSSL